VKGFWVSMPLDWGSKEASTPKAPQNSPAIIAKVESSTDKNRVGVA
jgi:hypothetical protein